MRQRRVGGDLRLQLPMQLQGDVGVFGGIVAGPRHIDLLEADALGTGASNIVVADGFHAQMPLGQCIHIVPHMRLQHIGLQQRVMRDTGQTHAMIGQYMLVVFDVLSQLETGRILQPWP